jgi:general secretion pathway protein G
MMELVFVIVIIGILAAVAVPKLFATRTDAIIAKVRNDVAAVRSSISGKFGDLIMEGNNSCPVLETNLSDGTVFEGVLDYPIPAKTNDIEWNTTDGINYTLTLPNLGKTLVFKYYNSPSDHCVFKCVSGDCDLLK